MLSHTPFERSIITSQSCDNHCFSGREPIKGAACEHYPVCVTFKPDKSIESPGSKTFSLRFDPDRNSQHIFSLWNREICHVYFHLHLVWHDGTESFSVVASCVNVVQTEILPFLTVAKLSNNVFVRLFLETFLFHFLDQTLFCWWIVIKLFAETTLQPFCKFRGAYFKSSKADIKF